jgi:hypothetical protein
VIVTIDVADTVDMSITKVELVDPLGTVTVAGTLATSVLLLVSETTAPPAGAGEESLIVPTGLDWLATVDWLSEMESTVVVGGAGRGAVLPEAIATLFTPVVAYVTLAVNDVM